MFAVALVVWAGTKLGLIDNPPIGTNRPTTPPAQLSAAGTPLVNADVGQRCYKAPYRSFIMPPKPPDWTEWYDIPEGCAIHLEGGKDILGRTVRVQCRSGNGDELSSCSQYSALRFQLWDRRGDTVAVIGFTTVPRLAGERPSWSEQPTDLGPGMAGEPEPPMPEPAVEPDPIPTATSIPADRIPDDEMPDGQHDQGDLRGGERNN